MNATLKAIADSALSKDFFRDVLIILVGCFIVSIGFCYFISPYKMVPGGVFGTCIVLHNFFPGIQIGTMALIIQVPLLLFSILFLDKRIGLQTLIATFAAPLMFNAVTMVAFDNPEAMQNLDPAQMFGGHLNMTDDLLVSCIIGGALVGFGTSLIIRSHASSGGTDIVAMLVHKFFRIHFSKALIIIDGVIVLSGLFVIGFGFGLDAPVDDNSWRLSLYSLITMIVMNRSLAWSISGNRDSKIIYTICEAGAKERLREWILYELDRTATHIEAKGLYTEQDKDVIIMVVRERELIVITDQIRKIAPEAFIIVSDSYDVYGYRWKPLPENNGLDFR